MIQVFVEFRRVLNPFVFFACSVCMLAFYARQLRFQRLDCILLLEQSTFEKEGSFLRSLQPRSKTAVLMFRQCEMLSFTILLVFTHSGPRRSLKGLYPRTNIVSRCLSFVIKFCTPKIIFYLKAIILYNLQLPLCEAGVFIFRYSRLIGKISFLMYTFKT